MRIWIGPINKTHSRSLRRYYNGNQFTDLAISILHGKTSYTRHAFSFFRWNCISSENKDRHGRCLIPRIAFYEQKNIIHHVPYHTLFNRVSFFIYVLLLINEMHPAMKKLERLGKELKGKWINVVLQRALILYCCHRVEQSSFTTLPEGNVGGIILCTELVPLTRALFLGLDFRRYRFAAGRRLENWKNL